MDSVCHFLILDPVLGYRLAVWKWHDYILYLNRNYYWLSWVSSRINLQKLNLVKGTIYVLLWVWKRNTVPWASQKQMQFQIYENLYCIWFTDFCRGKVVAIKSNTKLIRFFNFELLVHCSSRLFVLSFSCLSWCLRKGKLWLWPWTSPSLSFYFRSVLLPWWLSTFQHSTCQETTVF